jgi:hypothetical protein
MNGILIQPLRPGEYGPPMTRDTYLRMADPPLEDTLQADDLAGAAFPLVGLGKFALKETLEYTAKEAARRLPAALTLPQAMLRRGWSTSCVAMRSTR